jgi:hypothetical protein
MDIIESGDCYGFNILSSHLPLSLCLFVPIDPGDLAATPKLLLSSVFAMANDENVPGDPPLSTPPFGNDEKREDVEGGSSELPSVDMDLVHEERQTPPWRTNGFAMKCWNVAMWTPKRCRWDPEDPPKFNLALNLLFGFVSCSLRSYHTALAIVRSSRTANCKVVLPRANFSQAGTFTVANLYYSHPILNILADEFHVTNEQASLVPTVMQAGYAAGLLFLCPLGDIFPRRAYVLILVWFTATMVRQALKPTLTCGNLLTLTSGWDCV